MYFGPLANELDHAHRRFKQYTYYSCHCCFFGGFCFPNRVLWVHCHTVACRAVCTSVDHLIRHPPEISRYPAVFRLIQCGEAIHPSFTGQVAAEKIRKTRNKYAALCSSPRPPWSCWPFWASLLWPPILEVKLPDRLVPFVSVSYKCSCSFLNEETKSRATDLITWNFLHFAIVFVPADWFFALCCARSYD